MNPYYYVKQAVERGESLLSLCCGIGLELNGLNTNNITGVDLAPQYLAEAARRCPVGKFIQSDALSFLQSAESKSYDVVSMLDGLEHMDKATGRKVLKEIKRVAKKQVLLFFPQGHAEDGYLKNEPHDAWGISGADEYQTHKSGWKREEVEKLGFELIAKADSISQHDEPYIALMFKYDV